MYDFKIASEKFIGKSKEECYKLIWGWIKTTFITFGQFLELLEELEIMENTNKLA